MTKNKRELNLISNRKIAAEFQYQGTWNRYTKDELI